MDKTLTLTQFHQYTRDVQKTIPVKKKKMCFIYFAKTYVLILQTWQLSELVCYLDVLKHIGVVANLSQLHDSVHQCLRTTFAL